MSSCNLLEFRVTQFVHFIIVEILFYTNIILYHLVKTIAIFKGYIIYCRLNVLPILNNHLTSWVISIACWGQLAVFW